MLFYHETTGNVVEAVRHARTLFSEIRKIKNMRDEELYAYAKEISAPFHLVKETAKLGRLPVVCFSAGGISTPADAALMMQLGVDGVFVGSGIFKSGDPLKRAKAIVEATTHFNDPAVIARVSEDLGEPMVGIDINVLPEDQKFAKRGWQSVFVLEKFHLQETLCCCCLRVFEVGCANILFIKYFRIAEIVSYR